MSIGLKKQMMAMQRSACEWLDPKKREASPNLKWGRISSLNLHKSGEGFTPPTWAFLKRAAAEYTWKAFGQSRATPLP